MVLEALRSGLRLRNDLTAVFLKDIAAARSHLELRVVDVWVLLVLREMPQFAKQAESVFRRKVKAGVLTIKLLEQSIARRSRPLAGWVRALTKLADVSQRRRAQHRTFLPARQPTHDAYPRVPACPRAQLRRAVYGRPSSACAVLGPPSTSSSSKNLRATSSAGRRYLRTPHVAGTLPSAALSAWHCACCVGFSLHRWLVP